MTRCQVADCGRRVHARRLCPAHYRRWLIHGDPRVDEPVALQDPGKECSFEGCKRPARARGWCRKHWGRWKKHGDPSKVLIVVGDAEARFWLGVERGPAEHPDGWLWTGHLDADGYGGLYAAGKPIRAHRYAYELLVGPIPEGLTIDHLCHNEDPDCPGGPCVHRRCTYPPHLKPATPRENTLSAGNARKVRKTRTALETHCPQGHPYDQENTYTEAGGRRRCRTCRRQRDVRALGTAGINRTAGTGV